MGKTCLFIFIVLVQLSLRASTERIQKDWSYYSQEEVDAYQQRRQEEDRKSDYVNLTRAKRHLINGNLEMAEFYLTKIRERETKLFLIKKRYLALIAFIEGNYKQSLNYLNSPFFNESKIYPQICMLKLANLLALNNESEFDYEYRNCTNLTLEYGNNDQFWLKGLGDIKLKDKDILKGDKISSLKNILGDQNYTAMWMKLALFLNKESNIIESISQLPEEAYSNKKIRELIAFALYRAGKEQEALKFISDIETPNTENIRGNINLKDKKYELAFLQFQLALNKKQNSINALERSIPLAWMLGKWSMGRTYLKRVDNKKLDSKKKLALDTVFAIREEKFKEARDQLNLLEIKFKKKVPIDIDLMNNYVALRQGNKNKSIDSSSRACRRFDGLNCYILMKELVWDNVGKTLNRTDVVFDKKEFDIEDLKTEKQINPLKESVILDQKDIEELDDLQIMILP